MTFSHVCTPELFRELEKELRWTEIAERFGVSLSTVGNFARDHGIRSMRFNNKGLPIENEIIDTLRAKGWSIEEIAKHIGRSHNFVSNRVRPRTAEVVAPALRGIDQAAFDWPRPVTTEAKALAGRRYDEMPVPSKQSPGMAARIAQRLVVRATEARIGSSAAMCADA